MHSNLVSFVQNSHPIIRTQSQILCTGDSIFYDLPSNGWLGRTWKYYALEEYMYTVVHHTIAVSYFMKH